MAGAVWGIDIGKAALKAVKLRATKEGLEIKAVEHIDYEGNAQEEEKRAEQVREALKKFISKHKPKTDRVLVALPGLHAFSRFIKLPPVDTKKIGMMVRMEAQQQIPFPIADVNWDFQKIDRTYAPGEEIEVGIFATQRERITGFLLELNEQGLEPGTVTIAPLAIYNFIAYNQPTGEAAVVLDIGSDHTDLVVVDGPRFWIRNLRIAGNDITKALAERFKVSFEEAEKLKRNASKSEQSKKIFSSMEPTLKDLVGEVHRSVGFFKSQATGGELKINKMILLGDGSKLKNLPPFFEKELGYTVEKVTKLEQDKFVLDPDVDLETLKKHILGFGVALGLAIQGVGQARCSINLAPEMLKVQEELKRKVPFAAAAMVCAWLAFGLSYMTWSGWRDELSKTVEQAKKVNEFQKIDVEAKAADEAGNAIKAKMVPIAALVVNRLGPGELFDKLKAVLANVCKDNAKIGELTSEERDKSVEDQISLIMKRRQDVGADDRIWLLEMSFDRKPPDPGGKDSNGNTLPSAPERYQVVLKIARILRDKKPNDVRGDLVKEFVKPLCEGLKGEGMWIKKSGSFTPDAWYERQEGAEKKTNEAVVEAIVSANQELGHVDPTNVAGGPQPPYKEKVPTLALDVTFEIGAPPPGSETGGK